MFYFTCDRSLSRCDGCERGKQAAVIWYFGPTFKFLMALTF